jgi:hypothetical protein
MALPMGVSFVVVERPSGLVSIKPKPTSPQRFTLPKSANNLDATDREKPASAAYSPTDRPSFSVTPRNAMTIDSGSRSLNSRNGWSAAMRFRRDLRSSSDIDYMMIVNSFSGGTIWTKLFCSSRLCFALSTLLLEAFIVHTQRILLALVGLDLGGLEQLVCFQTIRVGHILYLAKKAGAGVCRFPLQRSSSRGVHPAAT